MPDKPLAQGRALRALAEGARPTLDILADASNRSLRMLRIEAERDGWRLDRAQQEGWLERVRATSAVVLDRIEAIGRRAAEEGGKIDKTEIDGLVALVRGLEKIGEFMRPEEAANENRKDEDLATVLGRIDDRIVELARELAAQILAQRDRAGRGGSGEGRMVP